jgi:hypothetical protein
MPSQEQLSINLGLPQTPETQSPELFTAILPIYNAVRNLARALDLYTGILPRPESDWSQLTPSDSILSAGTNRLYVLFTVDVDAAKLVNLYDDGGVLKARYANASASSTMARGFAPASVVAGDYGQVILFGLNPYLSGLTPGAVYFTSNSDGLYGTVAGTVSQRVGYALSETDLFFNPNVM